jgi:DNA-binding CsgD family transcriptional regulator
MTEINSLSDREKEVLQYVAAGLTNREIAQKLIISPNTVKVHLSNIFEKINVASRTEATVYAIEHRIVDVPGGENGTSGQQTGALSFLRQVKWYWLVIGVLLLVVLIAILTRTLFPTPTPPTIATADIAERWKELSPMPEARQGMAAVAFDGNIYTLAGKGPDGVSGSVFRYLPEEDRWETLNEKPTPVKDVEGVVIGEKIYVPGGETADGKPINILEIYDPRQDTWETGAPLPQALSAYALADFEGKMYLFGGWDGNRALRDVWVYDPEADAWRQGTQMNQAKIHIDAVSLSDRIVVVGGINGEDPVNNAKYYYPSREGDTGSPWESFVDIPRDEIKWKLAAISDSLYIVGIREDYPLILLQLKGTNWEEVPINLSFYPQYIIPVPLKSHIFLLMMGENQEFRFWRYQAIYYEIFFPLAD